MTLSDHFASNVRRVLNHQHLTVNAGARKWGMPQRTLSMIVNRERTPGIDTAEFIAKACGYALWQMLQPNFVPDSPPQLAPMTPDEIAFQAKVRELMAMQRSGK